MTEETLRPLAPPAGPVTGDQIFERFLDYVAGHAGVWFATISEIANVWVDEPTAESSSSIDL